MTALQRPFNLIVRRIVRATFGIALVAGGVALMLHHDLLRQGETILAAFFAHGVTPGEMYVAAMSHSFFWDAAAPTMRGLRVTAECTSAFLLGPLFIIAGAILASGRFGVARSMSATAVAAALLVLANQGRLVLIAWATAKWGVAEGYQWSHTIGGSLVVGLGVAVALVAFLVLLSVQRTRQGGRQFFESKLSTPKAV